MRQVPSLRFWKYLLFSGAAILILAGNFAVRAPRSQPLVAARDCRVSGSFIANGVVESTSWLHREDRQSSFGSSPRDEHRTGSLVSKAFAAPATLDLFVSGYPGAEGNHLSLKAVPAHERLILRIVDDPGEEWHPYSWRIPEDWQGRQVQLVAENNSEAVQGWFGLTPPRGGTAADERKALLSRTFFVAPAILWQGMIFFLPGIAAAWLLSRKFQLNEMQAACVTLFSAATAGYAVFWLYLASVKAGKDSSKAILLASAAIVVYAMFKRRMDKKLFTEAAICALLMATVTLFYTAAGFLHEHSWNPGLQAQERFVDPLPLDNVLPYFFADKLYRCEPVRPFLTEGWQSSDRPPLQAAITLLQFPFWEAANRELRYQILGTFLQSMWLAAVWLLLRSMRMDRRSIVLVCAACVFSRFFLMNTFFIWPKLLPAAFFILTLTVLRYTEGGASRITGLEAAIAGAGAGLAMLSHAGVAFSILGLTVVLVASRKIPPLRSMATGVAVLLLFLIPWMAYQKFYDPPGNRLVKWHLAGDPQLDSLSFSQALVAGYGKLSAAQIAGNKLENVKTLFGPGPWNALGQLFAGGSRANNGVSGWRAILNWYKTGSFFYVFQSPGLLDLGLVAFLFARTFSRKPEFEASLAGVQRLFFFFMAAMAVWCLLLYAPGSTLLDMGSMADETILFVALAASLALVTPRLSYAIVALQVLVVFPLSALIETSTASQANAVFSGGLDRSMAVLLVLSFLLLAYLGWKAGFSASGESLFGNGREERMQIQPQAVTAKEL